MKRCANFCSRSLGYYQQRLAHCLYRVQILSILQFNRECKEYRKGEPPARSYKRAALRGLSCHSSQIVHDLDELLRIKRLARDDTAAILTGLFL